MEIGAKIRELRESHGLTQQEMADKIGVSRAAIAKWETNKGIPDISNLIRISELFELSLDDLILDDKQVQKKLIADSAARRWHWLVILYLVAVIIYIGYFAAAIHLFMVGFLIATLFMLGLEIRVLIKSRK